MLKYSKRKRIEAGDNHEALPEALQPLLVLLCGFSLIGIHSSSSQRVNDFLQTLESSLPVGMHPEVA